jgi:hypothetical protein
MINAAVGLCDRDKVERDQQHIMQVLLRFDAVVLFEILFLTPDPTPKGEGSCLHKEFLKEF